MEIRNVLTTFSALLFGVHLISAQNSPIGYVDNVDSNGTVYGWAKDPDSLGTAIQVQVYSGYPGTTLLGTVTANYYHDTVAGYHGFRFTLPENTRATSNTLTVYGLDVTGDAKAAIQNGNPYPHTINVSANDNCVQHSAGSSDQIGPFRTSIAGGRPLNKNYPAQSLSSPKWVGGGLQWFQSGDTAIKVTCAPRSAGAIVSLKWDNVDFIDSGGHGAALQFDEHDNYSGQGATELFNPTEAGSDGDDSWSYYNQSLVNLNSLTVAQNPFDPVGSSHLYQHGSSSALQALELIGSTLHTKNRMAFWVPKNPVPTYGTYPKPVDTIYTRNLCRVNPPNPPGYNANAAYYSDFFTGLASRATHSVAASDTLDPSRYENTDAITDFTLDKVISWGVTGHPDLNNVMKIVASITLPATPPFNDLTLALYPDRVRFHQNSGSRTLRYNPSTHVATNITTVASGNTSDAVIAVDSGNRYAIAVYSRQGNATRAWTQSSTQGPGAYIQLGDAVIGFTAGTTASFTNYVIVGTLVDVESSLDELYTINPPP